MRRALLVLVLVFPAPAAHAAPVPAAGPSTGWDGLVGRPAPRGPGGARVETRPRRFAAFRLDRAALVPRPDVLSVPAPDGTLERFRVRPSPVLAPALARRFPQIRTYAGYRVGHPEETGRFDVGPLGFHASVRSDRGLWYVDPYYKGDDGVHVAYYRDQLGPGRGSPAGAGAADQLGRAVDRAPLPRAAGAAVTQRVYRLALANDPSYSAYFGTDDLLVEAAKAALINRVNQLYNDDLAFRLELVGTDYRLNFKTVASYTAAGYTASADCDGTLLADNQKAIDAIVGSANYDVGHIVKRSGGGGIAQLESVGRSGEKAQGCTGVDPPVGDGFAVDYVAHEMGHQFGGPHTFDGTTSNCGGGNRDGASAVEPGSGSSIQSYAGICGADDLQRHSDPYFSQRSIDDIQSYVTGTAVARGSAATVANRNPVVTAPADRTIPIRTPFRLSGSATDPDGDGLVYVWEQNDGGGATGQTLRRAPALKTDGPLFRVFGDDVTEDASQSPAPGQNVATAAGRTRSFPDPAQVAADDTDAETGTCAAADLDCNSEVLPTAGYAATSGALHFRLTARDRSPVGGGIDHDDVTLALAGTTPFAVTAPDTPAAPLTGGTTTTVTWNVAGTAAAPFDVPDVRIRFSTDGGLTFGYEVLATTPNDGTETVTVPNVATNRGRFEVEAIGNYFFDVSDGDITVAVDPLSPTPAPAETPAPEPSPAPPVPPVAIPTAAPGGSPTPSPTPLPGGSTSSATPVYEIPSGPVGTGTPAGTATPAPAGALRPVLTATRRRPVVSRRRRVTVRVRCVAVGDGRPPARCRGRLELRARFGRVAAAGFDIPAAGTRRITLRVSRRALRYRRLKATLTATVGARTAKKRVMLRRAA